MTKHQILLEAIKIELALEDLKGPNSPHNTHYMAQISPIFVYNAAQKDMDELMKTLKTKDAIISTLKKEYNTPGLFVFIKKKLEPVILKNNDNTLRLLRGRSGKMALLMMKQTPSSDPTYIVAWGFDRKRDRCSWAQGAPFTSLEAAVEKYVECTSLK